ncbi:fibronectin type III domain-containing protein, partial [Streptomyces sp. E5N91]|uniref:fibronectin type III domain-containing protein n=1 Tax=Streptomyces sp. E5N91 TaxID=1851996 RepID=UPI0012910544
MTPPPDEDQLALRPEVTVRYENGGLFADFAPVPAAWSYRIDVTADTGEPPLVYSVQVPADGMTGTVALSSDDFVLTVGVTYTVTVTVLGLPSEPAAVTAVVLEQVTVTARPVLDGCALAWDALPGATHYMVRVTDVARAGVVHQVQTDRPGATLTPADGLLPDVPYDVTVRARAGRAYGPWSVPVTAVMRSAVRILTALRDRLLAARTQVIGPDDGSSGLLYALDPVTLPDDRPEDAARVRTLLTAATGGAPAVTTGLDAPGPQLSATLDTLTLTGTSPAFGAGESLPADVVFTVSDDALLQATWSTRPPDGWTPSDLFEALDGSDVDDLWLTDVTVVATTWDHTTEDVSAPLVTGLNVQVTVTVRHDLRPAELAGADPAGWVGVVIGGPVILHDRGWPEFAWTTRAELGTLTARRVGQPDLLVTGESLTMTCVPAADHGDGPAVTARAAVAGGTTLGTDPIAVELTLATRRHPYVRLTTPDPQVSRPHIGALLTASGIENVLPVALPSALLDLAGASVYRYELILDPFAGEATTTVLTVGSDAQWTPAPRIGLKAPRLTLELMVAPGWATTTYPNMKVTLGATLDLGTDWDITAVLTRSGAWYLSFDNDTPDESGRPLPSLDALAGLADLAGGTVLDVLPMALTDAVGSVQLSRIWLLFDPDAAQLQSVQLSLAQTRPWPLPGDLLTLSGWTCAVALVNEPTTGWDITARLDGSITLASGNSTTAVAVSVPLPLDTSAVRLELTGEAVHLPTVGHVLNLLNGSPVNLPTGISTLGSIDITHLLMVIDMTVGKLTQLAFSLQQTGTWQVIEDVVTVSDVNATLAMQPSTTPVGVWGQISGTLEVVPGQPVDLTTFKNDPDDIWTLRAASVRTIHLPGFDALADWLAPGASRAALPSSLPLEQGLDFRDIELRFGGPGGTLDQVAFRVEADSVWTIVPGKLSLTDLHLSLTVPQPVVAADVTGSVGAVLTLAGVRIGLRADKPPAEGPWTFTGTLIEGFTIDVLALARGVGDRDAYGLPADAVARGLPASVQLVAASVQVIPDDGTFHADGTLGFDWQFDFAGAQVAVRSLRASLDIAATGKPLVVRLLGVFEVAGLRATVGLSVGTQDTPTVFTGSIAPADLTGVAVDTLADTFTGAAAGSGWSAVVPARLAPPVFATADVYLDVTGSRFLLHGTLEAAGQTALGGFLYVAKAPGAESQRWTYAVAVLLGADFRMGALVPVLSVVDEFLRITDVRLVICDLRAPTEADPDAGATLGTLATDTATLLAIADPKAQPPLAGLGQDPLTLKAGAYLTARLQFGQVSLFDKLLRIGSTDQFAEVRLTALIDAAEPLNTVYSACLPDLILLNAVVLTHTHSYPGIALRYQPAHAHRFELDGRIAFTGIFDTAPSFDVTLTVDDIGLTSAITQSDQQIAEPFGIPGIVLSGLGLDVRIVWEVPPTATTPLVPQTSRAALRGHVLLGPAPTGNEPDTRISVGATLVLVGGVPALFDLLLDRDFSLGAFLAQCLTGSGANWPTDFIDITLLSPTRISYYDPQADTRPPQAATVGGHTFPSGFSVDAHVRLTLITSLTLHGTVTITKNPNTGQFSDTCAAFQLEQPIDLGFLALASETRDPASGLYTGPSLRFTTGDQPYMSLAASVTFLGADFLQAGVNVREGRDGGNVFTGRLEAAAELEPFGKLSCQFRYETASGQFTVLDWPTFNWARELIDFVKVIDDLYKAANSGTLCGALSSLLVENPFHTSFSLTPNVSSHGTDLVFSLTVSCQMTVNGATEPFLNTAEDERGNQRPAAMLPRLNVLVPMNTRWSGLPQALAEGIGAAAGDFVRELLADPSSAAMFLGMVFGPKAAALALRLACAGLIDGAVAAASAAVANAVATAGGATAAGAVAYAIAAAAKSFKESDEHQPPDPGPADKPQQPALKSVTYADGAVTAVWDAARNAAGYTLELLHPNGSTLASQSYGYELCGALPVTATSLAAGTYQVRVRSVRGSDASAWSALQITKPTAPQAGLGYQDECLELRWTHPSADGFTAAFLQPDGTLITEIHLGRADRHVAIPLPEPALGAYRARVRAVVNGHIPGEWSADATLTVLSLPAPAPTRARHLADERVIILEWQAGTPDTAHQTVARTQDGEVAAEVTTPAGTAEATLPAPAGGWTAGTTYTLALRATGPDALSPWSTQDLTVLDMPAPEGLEAEMRASWLVASWHPVEPAGAAERVRYELTGYDAATPSIPIGHTDSGDTEAVLMLDAGRTPAEGDRYLLRVRAVTADNVGPWSTQATFDVHRMPPPSRVELAAPSSPRSSDLTGLTATWAPPTPPAALRERSLT